MSTVTVSPDGIAGALQEILTDYSNKLTEQVDRELKSSADNCKNEIQAKSPVKAYGSPRGRYKAGWAVKKTGKLKGVGSVGGYVVHNKTDYQLTHLLEKGHVSKNQYGTYGRVGARPHIGDAAARNVEKCIENLRNL